MLEDEKLLQSDPTFLSKPKAKRGRKAKGPTAKEQFRAMIANPSGIHPTEFKVVIRPEEIEKITKGGIILPTSEAEKLQNAATEGTIIAVSPLAFSYEKWPEGFAPPKVGDRIVYSKYSGMKKKGKDGVEYIIMNDKDVVAVLA